LRRKIRLDFIVQCGINGLDPVRPESLDTSVLVPLSGREEGVMVKNFEDLQQVGKENVDIALKSMGAVSKSAQAIVVEVTDYSKKAFEDNTAALEKLFGAKSLEKAIELQSEYAKSAYESFVAEATKIGELYADLAKESYKPFETLMAKAK
jgi:phasin family protein